MTSRRSFLRQCGVTAGLTLLGPTPRLAWGTQILPKLELPELEYARAHPPLVINLHWSWAPHAHLAMAYDEKVFPIAEFPMGEEIPKEFMSSPWLRAPDWLGIYRIA